jgi:hypothetical protein
MEAAASPRGKRFERPSELIVASKKSLRENRE